MPQTSIYKLISTMFLVSGTSIGGGMLAMPLAANQSGIIPATLVLFAAWAFMTITALILLEVSLWVKKDCHIITLTGQFLGPLGKAIAWVTYLFIAYFSLSAYISGGGDILEKIHTLLTDSNFFHLFYPIAFIILFGIVVEISSKAVSLLNSTLFWGMIITYVLLIAIGLPNVESQNLAFASFENALSIMPIFLTAFSFQMIVPSLSSFLKYDAKALKLAIVGGTSLSFVFYFVWIFVVLGTTDPASGNLMVEAYASGRLPISSFSNSDVQFFNSCMQVFSFFALTTSYLGISWGLFDFLADGLQVKKIGKNRLWLWLLVTVPAFLISLVNSRAFIGALEITGAYGDTILNGILPVLMLMTGVYTLKKSTNIKWIKNPALAICLLVFCCWVIVTQTV